MDRRLIWQLAFRYLRGKRSANAVPILSRISMVAIAVSSAAMIIIFSVFNGLESLIKDRYKAFYPDVRISVARGKFFPLTNVSLDSIKHIDGVNNVTGVIEDNVIALSNNQQIVIVLKGITNNYFDVNDLRHYIAGDTIVSTGNPYTAIGGIHILHELAADINNTFSTIELYYPNTKITNVADNPLETYQSLKLHPAGAFMVSDEFDDKYILAPLSLAQGLFREPGHYSSIELSIAPQKLTQIKVALQKIFGSNYKVEDRYEQNRTTYQVMSTEKWVVVAILVMVLLIASFNMIGALSMLVLEKQKDIAILKAMGALPATIRKIFLLEGVLWSLVGGMSGILLGALICVLQQKFGLIKLNGSFMVDAYPVKIQLQDIALVVCIIAAVGLLTSWYPAMRATKTVDPTLKSA